MLKRVPFYFLRHGETEWNKLRLMQGQTDTPLNPNGVVQAHLAAEIAVSLDIKTICASPLRRARHTADIIAHAAGATVVTFDGLMESSFGIYEGHPIGPWHQDWKNGAEIDGGETFADFGERSVDAVNQALDHAGPVLIVAHGGTFLSIRDAVLAADSPPAGNCQLVHFKPPRALWRKMWQATVVAR
jgi:probable phosphoglycerate mutase